MSFVFGNKFLAFDKPSVTVMCACLFVFDCDDVTLVVFVLVGFFVLLFCCLIY